VPRQTLLGRYQLKDLLIVLAASFGAEQAIVTNVSSFPSCQPGICCRQNMARGLLQRALTPINHHAAFLLLAASSIDHELWASQASNTEVNGWSYNARAIPMQGPAYQVHSKPVSIDRRVL
jgi:hypothetical protein